MSNRLSSGDRVNQWGRVGSVNGGGNGKSKWGKTGHGGTRTKEGTKDNRPRPSHQYADRLHTKKKPDGTMDVQGYSVPVLANPGNIVRCVVGGGAMGSQLAHENEAPFPEKLAEFFVRSFCPPGGIVLDPFCGSGTTLAVAKRTGRIGIGIDIRESQVELTKRRLAEVQPELEF